MPSAGIAAEVVATVARELAMLGVESPPIGRDAIVAGPLADAVLDHAAAALGDEAIGLTLAERVTIGSLGVLDYAMLTSATLGEGLQAVADYYGIATERARVELVRDGDLAKLVFHRSYEPQSRHWAELAMAILVTRIRQTLRRLVRFTAVSFTHAAPAAPQHYQRFFGVVVEFDAPRDELWFPAAWLAEPLVTSSPVSARLIRTYLQDLDAVLDAGMIRDRAARVLAAMLDEGVTTIDELGRRMDMPRRSLQRALRAAGTSHSQLVDDLRRVRAQRMLGERVPAAEVARGLAFASTSAFLRAHRRWSRPSGAIRETPPAHTG